MADILYGLLAIVVGVASIGVGVAVLFLPVYALARLGGGWVARPRGSVKDDVVNAQWEYDRKWRRR